MTKLILAKLKKAKEYKDPVAAYIAYSIDDMPADEQLRHDLQQMIGYYEKYVEIKMNMKPINLNHIRMKRLLIIFTLTSLAKGFIIRKRKWRIYFCL